MPDETVSKAALHKRLTTQPADGRIALILQVLAAAPERLRALSSGLSEAELSTPLGKGERSFKRDLTHLTYYAERDWGALMRYEAFAIAELMAYFEFRRRALLRILTGLSRQQSARTIRREGVRRAESVYFSARGLCVHELGHLEDLAGKLGRPLRP